jgi:hypothetical protein
MTFWAALVKRILFLFGKIGLYMQPSSLLSTLGSSAVSVFIFKCSFSFMSNLVLVAVPNFEELSRSITDPVNRAFFKNFCDRCSKLTASSCPAVVMTAVIPRLRQDQVILRAAALRWPSFASQESRQHRMRSFSGDSTQNEREYCKGLLLKAKLESSPTSTVFSPACALILDRIWDQSVPLTLADALKGVSAVEPADEALAREIIECAKLIQVEAETAALQPEGPAQPSTHKQDPRRGSFGGCDRSCTEHHYGMACDVCGVDYGLHSGK